MSFRHDAGVFTGQADSTGALLMVDGIKTLNPSSFGVRGVVGKKVVAQKAKPGLS
jgi:hypothetical protein